MTILYGMGLYMFTLNDLRYCIIVWHVCYQNRQYSREKKFLSILIPHTVDHQIIEDFNQGLLFKLF